MRTEITRIGGNLAVVLPDEVVDRAKFTEGSAVEVDLEGDHVVVRSSGPHYALDELLAGITADNIPDESFDDLPRGKELL